MPAFPSAWEGCAAGQMGDDSSLGSWHGGMIGEHYYGLRRAVSVLVGAGAGSFAGGEWSAGAGLQLPSVVSWWSGLGDRRSNAACTGM